MTHRRKSVDSSDSSASSDSGYDYKGHKVKKDKKDKKHKEDKKDKTKEEKVKKDKHHGTGDVHGTHTQPTSPPQTSCDYNRPPSHCSGGNYHESFNQPHHQQDHKSGGQFPLPRHDGGVPSFPSHQSQSAPPPPSGYRLPLTTEAAFPTDFVRTGQPPFLDADGSPVFIGSALLENSVHPCKIGPHLQPFTSVPYGGVEYGHQGRFDLLPFVPNLMEWVPTSHGRIPSGRGPVEGGYEENGAKLHHAVAVVNGVKVPGKAGEHLYDLFTPLDIDIYSPLARALELPLEDKNILSTITMKFCEFFSSVFFQCLV